MSEEPKPLRKVMKRYRSLEARYFAEHGNLDCADEAESRHLEATGRIFGRDGAVNTGAVVDGARLLAYENGTVRIRVDHSTMLEFWIEIVLPMSTLMDFVKQEQTDSEDIVGEEERSLQRS